MRVGPIRFYGGVIIDSDELNELEGGEVHPRNSVVCEPAEHVLWLPSGVPGTSVAVHLFSSAHVEHTLESGYLASSSRR